MILVAIGTMQGKNNIIDQRNKSGEYSNYPQEELLEFINKKMPKNAVFGGSMPTMATIKLVTKVCTGSNCITATELRAVTLHLY